MSAITDNVIDLCSRFLFATEEEMQEGNVPRRQQERILRLRDVYVRWRNNPKMTDPKVIRMIMNVYGVSQRQAYQDVRLVKICLGNMNACSKEYYRYLLLERCEESFEMARETGNASAFAATIAALGKYTCLDKEERTAADYSQITPPKMRITADPEVVGGKRIPNLDDKIRKIMTRFELDSLPAAVEVEAREVKPIGPAVRRAAEEEKER